MLRINQLKLLPEEYLDRERRMDICRMAAAKRLKTDASHIQELVLLREGIDARKKPDVVFSLTVGVTLSPRLERRVLSDARIRQVEPYCQPSYRFPVDGVSWDGPSPVIAGAGPAGLLCAYELARAGFHPIVLERGEPVEQRRAAVEAFWQGGPLDVRSNVQFGEGGAGTFSDGKLNTVVKDRYGRNREVLEVLVRCGAPEEILYEARPHVGTDVLGDVVTELRREILSLGGQVRFSSCLTGLDIRDGRIVSVQVNDKETLPCDALVLAIGHSARDTFALLEREKILLEPKPFAVGLRVEHLQETIQRAQYGSAADLLPPAGYRLAHTCGDGRGVYSFCMCPGGYVVNASSEQGRLAVNGMSYSGRKGVNANSAIVVTVSPEDFGGEGPLAGVEYQRRLEELAWQKGEGAIPVQRLEDYRHGRLTRAFGHILPAHRGEDRKADLTGLFSPQIRKDILEGMEQFGRQIAGFDHPDALFSGVESRTSSPVRILRNEQYEASVSGIYPCGEGAGYAGGITSAAMDGIKVAEAVAKKLCRRK